MSVQIAFFEAQAQRERILAAFAQNARLYLEALRGFAREIARRDGRVSVDDVRAECARRDFPLPAEVGLDTRVLGALFRSKEFVPVTQEVTTRPERIARAGIGASFVTVYRLCADTE